MDSFFKAKYVKYWRLALEYFSMSLFLVHSIKD